MYTYHKPTTSTQYKRMKKQSKREGFEDFWIQGRQLSLSTIWDGDKNGSLVKSPKIVRSSLCFVLMWTSMSVLILVPNLLYGIWKMGVYVVKEESTTYISKSLGLFSLELCQLSKYSVYP